jgi:hypothetical protein
MAIFKDIDFRYDDARRHFDNYGSPVLTLGYVDVADALQQILQPHKYMVHGAKGSGKTAFAYKLLLESKARTDLYVQVDNIEDLNLGVIQVAADRNLPGAPGGGLAIWKCLLLLRLINVILTNAVALDKLPHFRSMLHELEKAGITGGADLQRMAEATSKHVLGFEFSTPATMGKIPIPSIKAVRTMEQGARTSSKGVDSVVEWLLDHLRAGPQLFGKHILVVDGLDHLVQDDQDFTKTLRELVTACRSLNEQFLSIDFPGKVVLLLRDEILDKLEDANLTKAVNDCGIHLNWYQHTRDPYSTRLFNVAERRAHLAGFSRPLSELWDSWFPQRVLSAGVPSTQMVLDHTRFLPRDIVAVFRHFQGIGHPPPLRESDFLAGLRDFSAQWFVGELKSALVGLVPNDVREGVPQVLADVCRLEAGTAWCDTSDLFDGLKDHGLTSKLTPLQICQVLYNTNWIGNRRQLPSGEMSFSYHYRNRHSRFNYMWQVVVHRGLHKGLTIA